MHPKPVDHETILANGAKQIMETYRNGRAKIGRKVFVLVTDLHDPCGRAFAERVFPPHVIQERFGLEGGTSPVMKGACSFCLPIEKFAPDESGQELLSKADIPVVVVAKGIIFDVSHEVRAGARMARLLASGAVDPNADEGMLRNA